MDPNVIRLFGVMVAVMIPIALGGAVFVLVTSFARRQPNRRVSLDADALERLRERVEELERRETRVQEIEERLDFVERVLPGLREARPPLEPPKPPPRTPV